MSMPDRKRIGFDRTIASEWLDIAVARAMTGETPEATRKFLWDFLADVQLGKTHNSGRGKTLSVLTRIWEDVPEQAKPLKRAALQSVAATTGERRIAVHWAMVAGTHPFFFDVATHVGKLLKLHGEANRSQVKRRMIETWGDRSTLERTIQHVLRSMVQWGPLRKGDEAGSLIGPPEPVRISRDVGQLLLHSVVLGHGGGLPYPQLVNHPALFPFRVDVPERDLMRNPIFHVQRQGDQSDFVELASSSNSAAHSEIIWAKLAHKIA
jgi:hypothetical protein